MIDAGSIAHAGSDETNLMLHYHPSTVDISTLPPKGQPFHYEDFAIVDDDTCLCGTHARAIFDFVARAVMKDTKNIPVDAKLEGDAVEEAGIMANDIADAIHGFDSITYSGNDVDVTIDGV